ncbi:mannose-6-phosphate isomerase, partial [Rhizobium sp. KAs_5_22]
MHTPLFLKPHVSPKLWGHEEWAISAHANGPALIIEGEFAGQSLTTVWHEHPELFGVDTTQPFPLLIKELFVHDDLSIQVHPDDSY